MMPRITVRGVQDGVSSYSFHVANILKGLQVTGWDPSLLAREYDPRSPCVPDYIKESIVHRPQQEPFELLVESPGFKPTPTKRAGYITMFETTRIPDDNLENLNQMEFVIVPSAWNLSTFSAQGVTVPIYVVPMGIHPTEFPWSPLPKTKKTVFTCAGCKHGYWKGRGEFFSKDDRKNFGAVVEAFNLAFNDSDDVELRVKMYPGQHTEGFESSDSRIKIFQEFWSQEQIRDFYVDSHAFVSGTRGEGWGLMQHEAMACGRIAIAANFAGMTEFYDDAVGLPVRWDPVPASGYYEGRGIWAEPDVDDMAEQMLAVHRDWDGQNRPGMEKLGMAASLRANEYTWQAAWQDIDIILRDHGFDRGQ
tara:strand:+ start:11962 stop:13050 length:1089 start_codon:yes stop_codon:yes gene_type:complete